LLLGIRNTLLFTKDIFEMPANNILPLSSNTGITSNPRVSYLYKMEIALPAKSISRF
jgi:hypothetical protein